MVQLFCDVGYVPGTMYRFVYGACKTGGGGIVLSVEAAVVGDGVGISPGGRSPRAGF